MSRAACVTWFAIALIPSCALAQQPAPTPKFEVTSVKPNKSPDLSKSLLQALPGGRLVVTNLPLIRVIAFAWNLPLQTQRLILAPGVKMPGEVYDIQATTPSDTFPPGFPREERVVRTRLMIQALLEDRFKLKIRREPREQPVYVLVTGKDGPKLEKSKFQEQDCVDNSPKWFNNPACHFLNGGQDVGLRGSVTMAQLVEHVQNFTDRPLLDQTGLTGFYDIQTDAWVPMRLRQLDLDGVPESTDRNDFERPTLFNVFAKLGLRMEPQKAVIDTFVIEHIENPSEN